MFHGAFVERCGITFRYNRAGARAGVENSANKARCVGSIRPHFRLYSARADQIIPHTSLFYNDSSFERQILLRGNATERLPFVLYGFESRWDISASPRCLSRSRRPKLFLAIRFKGGFC